MQQRGRAPGGQHRNDDHRNQEGLQCNLYQQNDDEERQGAAAAEEGRAASKREDARLGREAWVGFLGVGVEQLHQRPQLRDPGHGRPPPGGLRAPEAPVPEQAAEPAGGGADDHHRHEQPSRHPGTGAEHGQETVAPQEDQQVPRGQDVRRAAHQEVPHDGRRLREGQRGGGAVVLDPDVVLLVAVRGGAGAPGPAVLRHVEGRRGPLEAENGTPVQSREVREATAVVVRA
mmetsp:Transcript_90983/g.266417  ORF Transcript_90983/g.266417 Transcript_90983/m.266417 type:complete len:231 (+) Transcript_90983:214-906(+)